MTLRTPATVHCVLLAMACSGAPHAMEPVAPPTSVAPSSAIDAIVCGTRAACRIVERRDAGANAAGDFLAVVKAWIGAPAYLPGVQEDGGCPDFEWWSIVVHRGEPRSHQFLVAGGNECLQWDGQAARVAPNMFTYVFAGSGAPIVREGLPQITVIQLSPVAVLSSPSDATVRAADTPIVTYAEW